MQSMFWNKNTGIQPQFCFIKVGYINKGVYTLHGQCYCDGTCVHPQDETYSSPDQPLSKSYGLVVILLFQNSLSTHVSCF